MMRGGSDFMRMWWLDLKESIDSRGRNRSLELSCMSI